MKPEEQIIFDLIHGDCNLEEINENCFLKENSKQVYLAMKAIDNCNYFDVCARLIEQGFNDYVSFVLFLVQVKDYRKFYPTINQCPYCLGKGYIEYD